jgi:hypothetical protein
MQVMAPTLGKYKTKKASVCTQALSFFTHQHFNFGAQERTRTSTELPAST